MRLRLPERLIDWLIARARRTPYVHLDGYMQRWWLFRSKGLSARIHRIMRSDAARDLHDHPWDNVSIVLRGGYYEEMPDASAHCGVRLVWRGPGAVVYREAEDRHRLHIVGRYEAWTLFIVFRKRRIWGFHTNRGFVPWHEYPDCRPGADEGGTP
jgi:hypothetical protein